jgi:uncharacterized repeat protein (TIGR02543 family)
VHDAIVLTGADMPAFLGEPVGDVRVYRFLHATGQWEPIPFQVDELDGGDSYFNPKNGVLDPNDEIVFLAKDLGDSVSALSWVYDETAKHHVRYRFSAEDPLILGQRGWAYVFLSAELPRSQNLYVQYEDPAGQDDWVETDLYRILHGNHGLQHHVFLKASAGGDGIDFVDRQKIRLKGRVDLGTFGSKTFILKEEMDEEIEIVVGVSIRIRVRKKQVDYLPGAVIRQHRKLTLEVLITGPFFDDIVYILPFVTTFYPTYVNAATGSLDVPAITGVQMTEMRISVDLNANSVGMVFYNKYNTEGIRIDGISTNYDNTLDWPGRSWHLMVPDSTYPFTVLRNTSVVTLYRLREDPPSGTAHSLYFKDDISRDDGDTGDRRSYGDTGIHLAGNDITGQIDFYSALFYVPDLLDTTQARDIFIEHFNPLNIDSDPERLTYTLTVNVDPKDAGRVDAVPPSGLVFADSIVVLTAVENPGYAFVEWTGDVSSTENPFSFSMPGNTNVTANFARVHDITVNSVPSGLNFSVDSVAYKSPHTFRWIAGSMHRVCADSIQDGDEGYRYSFISWNNTPDRCFDYVVPEQDDEVTVNYDTQVFLTTTVSPDGTGEVIPSPPGQWALLGAVVDIQASPSVYYTFFHWSGDLTGSENPTSLAMDVPKSITAVFGNYSPVVVAPDTSFAEDDTLSIDFQELFGWIADDNNHDTTLVIDIRGGSQLDVTVESIRRRINITNRQAHWNGVDTVFIAVTDPLNVSGFDEMLMYVYPTPDPPEAFSLLEPSDEIVIEEWPETVEFLWEPAFDPDDEESVVYVFELDTTNAFNSEQYLQISNIQENYFDFLWPNSYVDGQYYWRVQATDAVYPSTSSDEVFGIRLATGKVGEAPSTYVLNQNYPNPFNDQTTIGYGLPRSSEVTLVVYNSQGRIVRALLDERKEAGYYVVEWDGRNNVGDRVSTGLYFILFQAGSYKSVKKTILLR